VPPSSRPAARGGGHLTVSGTGCASATPPKRAHHDALVGLGSAPFIDPSHHAVGSALFRFAAHEQPLVRYPFARRGAGPAISPSRRISPSRGKSSSPHHRVWTFQIRMV